MKLIYCIHSVYNPGGMERVLLNKIRYWSEHTDWELMVVTTDQHERPPFYPFPETVRRVDLGINYSEDNGKPIWKKVTGYLRRRRLHRKRLSELLMRERADIVVSLYPSESSFLPELKDGSRKVLELHFNKFFRLQYGRTGVIGWIDRWRTRQDERIVRRFDKFVVLTQEDRGYWGNLPNLAVIPNAAILVKKEVSDVSAHRVIAVGRLDYQKGFDKLIKAWKIIKDSSEFSDWTLDIFGQGEWHSMLSQMILDNGLQDSLFLKGPSSRIYDEYVHSSLLVMSSNYEGFGMVLVEAMSCGVPAVAFACKCGPKDIIDSGHNGLLVPEGDVEALAEAMQQVMGDEALRRRMAAEARRVTERYSEEAVMLQWRNLFEELMKDPIQ